MKNLFHYHLPELEDKLVSSGFKAFHGRQIFNWLYKNQVWEMEKWTNISKKLKSFLEEKASLNLPKIVWHGLSKDGTRKFLLAMEDGNTVEAVAIPAPGRLTLCLSSQVGCAIGCKFCHTGTMGLTRHLETWEITGQFMAITAWLKENTSGEVLTNIVYMGQGEPLHNYENIKRATEIFLEPQGLGLGQRRITLSTSGLVPQIKKLIDFPPVNIAISLHSANDKTRTELMPINKVYDLTRLFEAIQTIPLKAHRRITYEYLLIKDLNDKMEDIEDLSKLLRRQDSKINLIPFNEYPESQYKRPSQKRVLWFMDQLIKKGFVCTIRQTKGDDILAACGQLKSREDKKLNLWEN